MKVKEFVAILKKEDQEMEMLIDDGFTIVPLGDYGLKRMKYKKVAVEDEYCNYEEDDEGEFEGLLLE